jgi:RND family efflux transporter MFP subunit
VQKRSLSRDVRTSARVVADERRLYKVNTKIEGWVERLFVSVTGQEVKRGEPLLTIYSPELVSAQDEYLIAVRNLKQLAQSNDDTAMRGAARLLEAAVRRLQFWDIRDDQIERLEKTGTVEKNVTLYAPASGWVTEKHVLAGQKIMPGDPLLVVADLTHVWGDADLYASDLPYVKVGMPVEITIPYGEGKVFKGTVSFITPTLDPATRTVKARLDIENPELLLKPDMYADAKLSYALGETLAIPESAVLRTGEHIYAFKDGGDSRLIPVEIRIGPRAGGFFQLLEGLNEGDRVVTSANFLVDSESSMKAALEAMAGGHWH